MKKYFTYVCLLALALFAFATHAEAGKFKFKLKTAHTVKIDLTKIFPDSDLKDVTITGLTKNSDGSPASGITFTSPSEMTEVYVDTNHEGDLKEIEVEDPHNVIKKIYFTPACGIAKTDLTLLEFDGTEFMDIEEFSFEGMTPAAPLTLTNAEKHSQNLKVLNLKDSENIEVYRFVKPSGPYSGSKSIETLVWGSAFVNPGSMELVRDIVDHNKGLKTLDFTTTAYFTNKSISQDLLRQDANAQAVRRLIEYLPHYAENKLTINVEDAWESTVNVIAPLKKVTIKPAKTITGTADPKVYVTTYKFKYTLESGEEVKIAPNTTKLSEDKVANITAPGTPGALLYKTADEVYYSLNEGKNHNGENSHADAYGAWVVAPYAQIIEIVYDGGATKWYVSDTETVGVPNLGLTANQTVETKVIGQKSGIGFSYYVASEGFTGIPVADLRFISVKGIDSSEPVANPNNWSDDNYRYGRTMTGFTAENAPKREGYRFKRYLANIQGASVEFAGPDFVLTKGNSSNSLTMPTAFGIALEYVPVHKVHVMYPKLTSEDIGYTKAFTFEVDHNGTINPNSVPSDAEMNAKFKGFEFKGWALFEKEADIKETASTYMQADLSRITVDKDYYLVAMYWKLYTVTFMGYNSNDQMVEAKVMKNVRYGYILKESDFPTPAVRKGYDFKGWANSETPTHPSPVSSWLTVSIQKDLTLVPVYEASVYNITYVMHPSTLRKPSSPKTATAFESVKLPSVTAPADYKFLGWSVNTLNADKVYKAGENFSDYDADFTLHSVVHYNYNAQLDPKGIADFCARVGVAPSYKEAKDYIQNFKAISEATVVDIVDLNNATAVVKKVDFVGGEPKVAETGLKEIKVQLTYTDGSTDQVTVYMTVLDATDLKNVIAEGEHELKNPTYTDVSALRTAIASAKTVYAKNDACKAELEVAKNDIITALNALVVQYEPLPEDQIAPADRIAIEYGINVSGAATYNATYGGAEVANHRVFKKGYTFVMNVTPAAGYSLEFFTIYKYNAKAKAFEVKDRVETFAQTLRYRFAEAGSYKVVANFSKGEYTFTYGVRNEAGKGAEFVAMYNGSAIKSGDKVPAGAKVRLVVALQDKARIVKWFVNDAVAAISAESRDNEFTVNADTKVEVELANVTAAEAVAASVKVGPNPFTNFFVIRGAQDFATYYVLNATGNRVAEGMVAGMNEVRVNAQSFAPGFYVVVLKKADGTVQAVKMIKR